MKAFYSDPAIKQHYVDRIRGHMADDELVQNYGYWKNGRGCAVGCSIHSGNHADYENLLGIPEELARLEDGIFYGLPVDDARQWPLQFMESIAPGADLSMVWPKFTHWLLTDPQYGAICFADEMGKAAIHAVADLLSRWIAGEKPSRSEWDSAYDAASSAAYAALYSTYRQSAAYASSAAYAALYSTYRQSAVKVQSEKLLQLLSKAI